MKISIAESGRYVLLLHQNKKKTHFMFFNQKNDVQNKKKKQQKTNKTPRLPFQSAPFRNHHVCIHENAPQKPIYFFVRIFA